MRIKIPFTDIVIARKSEIEAEVNRVVAHRVVKDSAFAMKRYAHNPDCIRAAVAAHCGVTNIRFIAPDTMLAEPMTRAIEAFAERMAEVRTGARP